MHTKVAAMCRCCFTRPYSCGITTLFYHQSIALFVLRRIRNLSPECLDFVRSLIQDPDRRLGRNGADEIKGHPWFRGIDWGRLHVSPRGDVEAAARVACLGHTTTVIPSESRHEHGSDMSTTCLDHTCLLTN